MFRRDLLKKYEKHLLLHDYDYDNGSFLENINALANHLGDLLMLADGDKVRVYDEIVDWFKDNFKPRLGTYTVTGNEPENTSNGNVTGVRITLPSGMKYDKGKNNMYVSYNGTVLYKDTNYKEVANGTSIDLLFIPRKNDLLRFKVTRPMEVEVEE